MWINQHILAFGIAIEMDRKAFAEELPFVIAPDSLRFYYGPRPYTHFEIPCDGSDVSWCEFPSDLKNITKSTVDASNKFLGNHPKAVIGDLTSIDAFIAHNQHLPEIYYRGCFRHFTQDTAFDDFIRIHYDCSRKFEDVFTRNATGETFDGKTFREQISSIEMYGYYILAKMASESFGITANNAWIDSCVKPVLLNAYADDLTANTLKFMTIPESYNTWISNGDWSHINSGFIPDNDLYALYDDVMNRFVQWYSLPQSSEITAASKDMMENTSFFDKAF